MCRTFVASEDWLFVSNRVSTQDSVVVGPHSPQFPLGGERTQQSFFPTSCLLETIIIHLQLLFRLYY